MPRALTGDSMHLRTMPHAYATPTDVGQRRLQRDRDGGQYRPTDSRPPPLRGARRGYQGWLVANMAQTTLPMGPGSVQPHSSHSESTTCSPRPDSPNEPRSSATGTSSLGSEIAHSTHGPRWSRPSRPGQRGHTDPGQGTV